MYESTVRLLIASGYDVKRAREIGLSAATDVVLLARAEQEGRILITRDKGFGQLVFSRGQPHAGVILLRITPDTLEEVHHQLMRFLFKHTPQQLSNVFATIEPGRYRARKSPVSRG
ncbi:MAG: DUF5615 family PIN-like protein [Armatimonadota bacterium]|nr:DUF5615 family PIN-like protein [bacterium]MDW8320152.1 DUF5615 family PIN-like protein [Armatimonadota bacterium]